MQWFNSRSVVLPEGGFSAACRSRGPAGSGCATAPSSVWLRVPAVPPPLLPPRPSAVAFSLPGAAAFTARAFAGNALWAGLQRAARGAAPEAVQSCPPQRDPSSDQPLGRGHLDHVPHFHSGPVLLLPARAVGSLSRSPPLHGNRRGYGQCEEQGSPRGPDCSHHGGVAEVRPHSLLW